MGNVTQIQDMHGLLKSHGLRATPQRIALAEFLFASAQHVTPLGVYESLCGRFPSLSRNTVYLTLAQFEQKGLLRRLPVSGRMLFDTRLELHDHACCRVCGDVVDVAAQPRSETMPNELGAWSIEHEGRIWCGVCPHCVSRDVSMS